MKELFMSYVNFWKDAETPFDYMLKIWATILTVLAFSGILILLFELITNPSQFNSANFGLIDTLGS